MNLLLLLAFSAFAAEPPFYIRQMETQRDVSAMNENFRSVADDLKQTVNLHESQTIDGTKVYSGTVSFSGTLSASSITINGISNLNGLVTIGSMTVTSSPGSPPAANTIYKQNIPKAFIFFSQATDAINDSHNISSITDGANGQDVVNFDRDFLNTGYAIFTHHTCHELGNCIASQATGSATVSCYDNTPALADCSTVSVFVFGNQ